MKSFLFFTLLIWSISCHCQFHLKIECYGYQNGTQWYAIKHTNDNWKTSPHIMEQYTIGNSSHQYAPKLFNNKNDVTVFAKTLDTWDKCVKYNLAVDAAAKKAKVIADRYKAKEDEAARIAKEKEKKKSDCCKEIKIY